MPGSNGWVCYKVLDDFGHLEGRNRSRILFTDRLPHLLALGIFLDFPERDPWAMCTGLGRSPPVSWSFRNRLHITLYMPKIFEIGREFDQKRYICPVFKQKFLKFSENVIYAHRYIWSYTPVPKNLGTPHHPTIIQYPSKNLTHIVSVVPYPLVRCSQS